MLSVKGLNSIASVSHVASTSSLAQDFWSKELSRIVTFRDGTGCDHDAVAVNGSAKRPDELPLTERLAKFQAAQAAGNNVT